MAIILIMKLCLACSAGGHLDEMLQLEPLYKNYGHFFITFSRQDSESALKNEKVYFIPRPARNPFTTIADFFRALKILLKEKPDAVIATGADVTVPICYAAKLLGKKVIFSESFCRPYSPSISGRLVYPIADLFIIQWKDLAKFYPKAVYGGSIF